MTPPAERSPRPFHFQRDTFAFRNELFWEYRFDPVTGKTTTFNNNPRPNYAHRCFIMVRSVRQFHYHARFEPGLPVADEPTYRRLVRQIVSRTPRCPSAEVEQVVVPGYDGLRSFSQAHEPVLKAECGGPWASYFLRSHWRMVAPTKRWHQEQMAQQLTQSLPKRQAPVVHLYRFPHVTINHGIVLFRATESEQDVQFDAYDPNIPEHPVKLIYERAGRTFVLPQTHYWAGGKLNVYEIFSGGLYLRRRVGPRHHGLRGRQKAAPKKSMPQRLIPAM